MTVDGGQLDRNLGFLEAMTLGGGTMIGAGIFILPGLAAEGAGPASAISFVIAGFVALLAALSLAELATGMPIAGGSYHYVNRALGGLFGSIVGWGMWTGLMFASAFYMIGFGQYIVVPIPFLDGRALIVLLGLIGLGLITVINVYGTDESSGAQNVMIGAELAVVLAYVALGVFFIEPGNLDPFAPTGASGIVATTGTVFVTYLGFEIIATVAGEIERPGKLIPLTMVLSVVSVTLLYAVIMLISTGVVPYRELGGSLVPVSDVAAITMLGTVGVVAVTVAISIPAFWLEMYVGLLVLTIGVVLLIFRKRVLQFSWLRLGLLGTLASFNKGLTGGGYGPLVTGGQLLSGVDGRGAVGVTTVAQGLACFAGIVCYVAIGGQAVSWALVPYMVTGGMLALPLCGLTVSKLGQMQLRTGVALFTLVLGLLTLVQAIR